MRGTMARRVGMALVLLLGATGCTTSYQAPGYVEIQRMTELDGGPDLLQQDRPLSPVMRDVYDRSIPEDVYSTQ
ncbi:hypothetical protein C2I18_23775 [Paenibacillus sp. PK3_47]|uniref:hypothetical protein n=1 Tax=Paenibacillus sp. PK3_47 TaxID=2072642 RepID=UPI00201E4331|nr:hypothetical protein [Paenibacillus sp. PK3_47]UQZ36277.1 hypothetical protein C2I18_23775 [Paenibacillus sp. PK3_47]